LWRRRPRRPPSSSWGLPPRCPSASCRSSSLLASLHSVAEELTRAATSLLRFLDHVAGRGGDTHLGPVLQLVADPSGIAVAIDESHVGNVDRGRLLDDAAGLHHAGPVLHVALDPPDPFHDDPLRIRRNPGDL